MLLFVFRFRFQMNFTLNKCRTEQIRVFFPIAAVLSTRENASILGTRKEANHK